MDYKKQILNSLEEVGLDTMVPKTNPLVEIAAIDGESLSTLSSQKISSLIFNLSRYQVYLQVQCNVRSARFKRAKRDYNLLLFRVLSEMKGSKLTVKEKTAKALTDNPDLAVLELELAEAEAEDTVFQNIPTSTVEIINSLKKELSIRANS